MVGPVMMIAQTLFICGLPFGRRVTWDGQNRADRSVGAGEALRGLWPQLVFALAGGGALWLVEPRAAVWALPTLLPCLLAAPFTCLTASQGFGRRLVQRRLCAVPEEIAAAETLEAALRLERAAKAPMAPVAMAAE